MLGRFVIANSSLRRGQLAETATIVMGDPAKMSKLC